MSDKFTHLQVHSHYSLHEGIAKVPDLVDKCIRCGMHAMALTDMGMFGIKKFLDYADKVNVESINNTPFKPIVGLEVKYGRRSISDTDKRLVLLAKNKKGYQNLCKISFTSYLSHIDYNTLEKWHEGLICCSVGLESEVAKYILSGELSKAEETLIAFKNIYGGDYYLGIQRHIGATTDFCEKQERVNNVLTRLAHQYGIKLIATNDVRFVEKEHADAHEIVVRQNTGKYPYSKQEWLKTPEEMEAIFEDMPEVLINTQEIVAKVESYSIKSEPVLPIFPIPQEFGTEEEYRQKFTEQELYDEFTSTLDDVGNRAQLLPEDGKKRIEKRGGYEKLYRLKLEADYLAKLTWNGAHKRYGGTLTQEQTNRIAFELHAIKTMSYPAYFLIVQDFIRAAREELDVSVGPGRGSAAGSVVNYCLGITNIDPLKHGLLFERFLDLDRISLPDIDVDPEDGGRGKVLDWVTHMYGAERVARIITYGTMRGKSLINNIGGMQNLSYTTIEQIKNYIPDKFSDKYVNAVDGILPKKMPPTDLKNCYKYVPKLREMLSGPDKNVSLTLTYAQLLEGIIGGIGIHACGFVVGKQNLADMIPLCVIEDKNTKRSFVATQYDSKEVEGVGLVKIDFLGLITLTFIKEILKNIKLSKGIYIDIDHILDDDAKTYQLFCEGNTDSVFRFASPNMQELLRELKPDRFTDLIAMNALYRPWAMQYIPTFINRKLGKEPIVYDILVMEQCLKETYGVVVYQEQIMQLCRLLANFSCGEVAILCKALCNKNKTTLVEIKPKFISQAIENGHPKDVLEKIWSDWVTIAPYTFNKSHAVCYTWIAYQTAYLKANFPTEYADAKQKFPYL